jgi:hypothetical protein
MRLIFAIIIAVVPPSLALAQPFPQSCPHGYSAFGLALRLTYFSRFSTASAACMSGVLIWV